MILSVLGAISSGEQHDDEHDDDLDDDSDNTDSDETHTGDELDETEGRTIDIHIETASSQSTNDHLAGDNEGTGQTNETGDGINDDTANNNNNNQEEDEEEEDDDEDEDDEEQDEDEDDFAEDDDAAAEDIEDIVERWDRLHDFSFISTISFAFILVIWMQPMLGKMMKMKTKTKMMKMKARNSKTMMVTSQTMSMKWNSMKKFSQKFVIILCHLLTLILF